MHAGAFSGRMGSTTCQLAAGDEGRVTPAFQAGVSPYDCLWGKGPGSAGLSGQGQPCNSEQHTQAGIPHRASLRSAQAWGWTEDAPTCFPGWHVASGISTCSLSLVQVGCFLKTPRFPIWVVCSESHFSVLFSQQLELLRDWRTERLFDLYYYDGLANQQEQIRLTIGAPPPHPSCVTGEPSDWSGMPALARPLRAGREQCRLDCWDWGIRGRVRAGPPAGGGQHWALRNRGLKGWKVRWRLHRKEHHASKFGVLFSRQRGAMEGSGAGGVLG